MHHYHHQREGHQLLDDLQQEQKKMWCDVCMLTYRKEGTGLNLQKTISKRISATKENQMKQKNTRSDTSKEKEEVKKLIFVHLLQLEEKY